ncbi:MAG: SRPBCC family protein [Dermatophilaceae bacterium]
MPTDHATETVIVAAPVKRVLATVRDVGSQPKWVKEVLEAEVLEKYDDGTGARHKCRSKLDARLFLA